MPQHRFDFIFVHELQKARRHADERRILKGARCKRIGFPVVNPDFGHRNPGAVREFGNDAHEPRFQARLRIGGIDELHVHAHLCHRLTHQERNHGPREAHDHRKNGQRPHIEGRTRHTAEIDAEHHTDDGEHDIEHHHHGNIGENEKSDTFQHVFILFMTPSGTHGKSQSEVFTSMPSLSPKRGGLRISAPSS